MRPQSSYQTINGATHTLEFVGGEGREARYLEKGPDGQVIPDPSVSYVVEGKSTPAPTRLLVPEVVFQTCVATQVGRDEQQREVARDKARAFLEITPLRILQHDVSDGLTLQLKINDECRAFDRMTAGPRSVQRQEGQEALVPVASSTSLEWGLRAISLLDGLFNDPKVQARRLKNGLENAPAPPDTEALVRTADAPVTSLAQSGALPAASSAKAMRCLPSASLAASA